MNDTLIISIGPIFDSERRKLFFYVPLLATIEREQVVLEATDEAGLAALSAMLPAGTFSCAPSLAGAARSLSIPVREPSSDEQLLACDVALGLKPLQGVASSSDRLKVRQFLTALAKLMQAPVWHQLRAGTLSQGSAEGMVEATPIRVEMTVGMRDGQPPALLFSILGTGTDNEGDVDLVITEEPKYLAQEIQKAYGVSVVPRLFFKDGPSPQVWNDRWLPVLTAAMTALATLGGQQITSEATTDKISADQITCEMRLLG